MYLKHALNVTKFSHYESILSSTNIQETCRSKYGQSELEHHCNRPTAKPRYTNHCSLENSICCDINDTLHSRTSIDEKSFQVLFRGQVDRGAEEVVVLSRGR